VSIPRAQAMIGRLASLPRYIGASVVALAADTGLFLALLRLHMPAMAASATGYGLGIVVHWYLSSRLVFAEDLATQGPERMRQQALFVASALAGLGITMALVGAGAALGIDPRLSKGVAVAVSFMATWALRKGVVFA